MGQRLMEVGVGHGRQLCCRRHPSRNRRLEKQNVCQNRRFFSKPGPRIPWRELVIEGDNFAALRGGMVPSQRSNLTNRPDDSDAILEKLILPCQTHQVFIRRGVGKTSRDSWFCLPSARAGYFEINGETEFTRIRRLEYEIRRLIQSHKMFATGQLVGLRRDDTSRDNASFISPSSEGLSLSFGSGFSGNPSTLRLCCTKRTYSGEHFGRVETLGWDGVIIGQQRHNACSRGFLKYDLFARQQWPASAADAPADFYAIMPKSDGLREHRSPSRACGPVAAKRRPHARCLVNPPSFFLRLARCAGLLRSRDSA